MTTENLTTAQAAEMLELSANKVRDMISDGSLPNAFKEGRSWRIPASDVTTFLNGTGAEESVAESIPEAVAEAEEVVEEVVEEAVAETVDEVIAAPAEAVEAVAAPAEPMAMSEVAEVETSAEIKDDMLSAPSGPSFIPAGHDPLMYYLFGSYIAVMVISIILSLIF